MVGRPSKVGPAEDNEQFDLEDIKTEESEEKSQETWADRPSLPSFHSRSSTRSSYHNRKFSHLREMRRSTAFRGNLYQGRLSMSKKLQEGQLGPQHRKKTETATLKEIQTGLKRFTVDRLPKKRESMLPDIFKHHPVVSQRTS